MSSVTVKYHPKLETMLQPHTEALCQAVMVATAQALGTDPQKVIVEIIPWGKTEPSSVPDILFRGETSARRRDQLKHWGQTLLEAWRDVVATNEAFTSLSVAAKTYVIDLEWAEITA